MKQIYRISLANMLLTIIHHLYGSYIYEDSFRLHVVFVALPVSLLIVLLYRKMNKAVSIQRKRRVSRTFLVTVQIVPMALIGFYEGLYNHVLKNLLFFSGATKKLLLLLFPPPTYEMPNNLIFEFTGIMQGVLGIVLVVCIIRFSKKRATG